ncbi:MAG: PIG-L family deacetylase [Thaumarchaeota archaeon]|nr:PIG-L family deacetylase [Nitrososphaerota archaeon]
MEILAIGAHPDDVELGAGGFLLSAARSGHGVYIYTLTRGAAGGEPGQRVREAQKSAQFMGAKALWLDDLPDSRLEEGLDLISRIESRIDLVHPDIILTHYANDVHHDHRTIARATMEAGRYDSNILAYEIPLTRGFDPKVYFDISDVIDDKVQLVRMFASQSEKFYLRAEAIRGLAEFRALQSRFQVSAKFVETFDASKLCLGNDFMLRRMPYQKQGAQPVHPAQMVEIPQLL